MRKTLWETQNRSFSKDLSLGKIGEQIVINHLKSYRNIEDVRDISNSKRGIDEDVDLELVYKDGHISTLEIKTDTMAHRTGNIAYEELSHKNPGCFARTTADHILYFLIETGEAYVLNPQKFRNLISNIKRDFNLAQSMNIRATKMGQGASGYLVPISSIINTGIVECKLIMA